MKSTQNSRHLLQVLVAIMVVCCVRLAGAGDPPKQIQSGLCVSFSLQDIPVGDFDTANGAVFPEASMRITQHYNNSKEEGYCNVGNLQPPATSDSCKGLTIWYGHDGIDIHELGVTEGINPVNAIQSGYVVASVKQLSPGTWGESIIIATRTNSYSSEIITHHYHHLHATQDGNDTSTYTTTRLYNACEKVNRGDEIARMGQSGTGATHLHFGVRRWKNIGELQSALQSGGAAIYGYGYSFGDNSRLAKHLDPERLLRNIFSELQTDGNSDPAFGWATAYILQMRQKGIEFGLFDGSFGAAELVKRREAARWIKIAGAVQDYSGNSATFPDDVPATDPDFIYIESLARNTLAPPVVNPDHSCYAYTKRFCPDNNVSRAEALKMVILAFFRDGFLKVHNDYFWRAQKALATSLAGKFDDVNPLYWYSEYVYYGSTIGLVTEQKYFRPDETINRAELSKWIIVSLWHKNGSSGDTSCNGIFCGEGTYCDSSVKECMPLPECIPSETQQCEMGGGYDKCASAPDCFAGQTFEQSCNGNGKQTLTCLPDCTWGEWSACSISAACTVGQSVSCGNCGSSTCVNGQWGVCQNQGSCTPSQTQSQSCNVSGTQSRTCSQGCQWGDWGTCSAAPPACSPGQQENQSCTINGLPGTMSRTCNNQGQWNSWSSCTTTAACNSGATQSCGNCGSSTCVNGQWGACQNQGSCTPSQTQSQSCNVSGTQSRTCSSSCQWGAWGTCSADPAVCNSGATQSCGNCGTSTCVNGQWGVCQNQGSCTPSQTQSQSCNVSGTQSRTCSQSCQWGDWGTCSYIPPTCTDKYIAQTLNICFDNPGSSGNPVICMELKQLNQASWQYRACRPTGVFGSNGAQIKYRLRDANQAVNFTYFTEDSGSQCTAWRDFSVAYLSGYGASNGAGLYVEILSPSTCTQTACTYKTGESTIHKECQ